MLKFVNVKVVVAVEAHQIVAVAFMVSEEEILAMDRAVLLPPAFGFFYGFTFGMIVICKRNVMFSEIVENSFFSCHTD
jgi:hypothetical protein